MEYKIYTSSTILEFGRYKGKTFTEAMKEDIKYVEWFIREIDNVILTGADTTVFNENIQVILYNRYNEWQGIEEYIEEDDSDSDSDDDYNYDTDYIDEYNDRYTNYRYNEYSDYYNNEYDMWADIAGTDDPDIINDVYWNLD